MKAEIGSGIYTTNDIALILKEPKQKVRYWMKEYWSKRYSWKGESYAFGSGPGLAINFLSFIELYVFLKLRKSGVSVQSIHKARENMIAALNTPYPFAKARVLTDGSRIAFATESIPLTTADKNFQFYLEEIAMEYLSRVDYGQDDMVCRYWPDGKDSSVVVDPEYRFGYPIIQGTSIPTDIILYFTQAGETKSTIAHLYHITIKQIEDVLHFYRYSA